jgi:hypothetical protein
VSGEIVERVRRSFLRSPKKSVRHASRELETSSMTMKDKVFVPPLPASIPDLQSRSTATVVTITPDLLIKVRQELDYSLDVCRVASDAHIEHL